ncbi:MAG: hypothetical protein ACP5I3_06055 [Thermoproteus sp.]
MVGGSVIAVLSNDEAKAVEIAERLGKRERGRRRSSTGGGRGP